MPDHTRPGTDQSHIQQFYTDIRANNPDSPHANNVIYKWQYGFTNALHQPLYDHRHPIEWLRKRYHSQNSSAQEDHLLIFGKDTHQRWCAGHWLQRHEERYSLYAARMHLA